MADDKSPFLDESGNDPKILDAVRHLIVGISSQNYPIGGGEIVCRSKSEVIKKIAEQQGVECVDVPAVELEPSDLIGIPMRDWSNGPGVGKSAYVQPHEKTKFDFDAIYGTCCDEIDASNDLSEVIAALDKFIDGHEDKLPLLSTLVKKLRTF
jgi:hypothetical protein